MKGGLAAFMMAAKALKKSGVKLRGDVIFAAVEGVGTHHLLTHGMHSDYAVVVNGSDLNIVWTQTGVVQVKIATFGKAEAAWGTKHATHPPEKLNAIVKMTKIINALERWAEQFEEKYIDNSPTGPLYPKVDIGAIEGGAPYRPNYFPGVCHVYVDIRFPPQVRPVTVKYELEKTLHGVGLEYEIEIYKSLLGHEGKGVEPLVRSVEEVYYHLFNEKVKPEAPNRASIWTDTNIYNELGIPAVKIGPRGRRIGPRAEEIDIDVMPKAAQIYALVALHVCCRERPVQ